jgi:hypothetical protein
MPNTPTPKDNPKPEARLVDARGNPLPVHKSRRGGKRPGAGAPKGNLNALKHGRRSRQFAELGAIIAASDTARNTLEALAHRRRTHEARAEQAAAEIIAGIYTHARDIATGKDSPGMFRHLLGLNAKPKASSVAQSRRVASGDNEREAILNTKLRQIRAEMHENSADNQPLPIQSMERAVPDTNQPPESNH